MDKVKQIIKQDNLKNDRIKEFNKLKKMKEKIKKYGKDYEYSEDELDDLEEGYVKEDPDEEQEVKPQQSTTVASTYSRRAANGKSGGVGLSKIIRCYNCKSLLRCRHEWDKIKCTTCDKPNKIPPGPGVTYTPIPQQDPSLQPLQKTATTRLDHFDMAFPIVVKNYNYKF